MAYSPIIPSETDPDAPLTSFLAKRWSDNWEAGFEGEPGAPRLRVRALGRLTSGSNWLFRDTRAVTASGSGSGVTIRMSFGVIQQGTGRISFEYYSMPLSNLKLDLVRSGTTFTQYNLPSTSTGAIGSWTAVGPISVGLLQGDRIDLSIVYTTGASGAGTGLRNLTLSGNSEVFPTEGMFGLVHFITP